MLHAPREPSPASFLFLLQSQSSLSMHTGEEARLLALSVWEVLGPAPYSR